MWKIYVHENTSRRIRALLADYPLKAQNEWHGLRQDQFAYEELRVIDVVMMGHQEMWAANEEKNRLYANPEATEDDYMKAAELEGVYAEYDGIHQRLELASFCQV